jgi:indolepyruvate ferredoxin oxidoreductase beta subunit
MENVSLPCDPYNVIITGVGGQGNVMASRVVGNILSRKNLNITIGETFGASQRGGSVMSHLRISSASYWSGFLLVTADSQRQVPPGHFFRAH